MLYISFIIAGMLALLSIYSYAKLGARYPYAGGPAEFLIRGFGDGILSGGLNILPWIGYISKWAYGKYSKRTLKTRGVRNKTNNLMGSVKREQNRSILKLIKQ